MKTVFLIALLLVSIFFNFPDISMALDDHADSVNCSSAGEMAGPSPEWIRFHGEAIEKEQVYLLIATNGSGAFEIGKDNVRFEDGRIEVRVGVDATVIDPANGVARARRVGNCNQQDDCPSKCASCIGFVRVCCGGGGTRGVCLGFYGCP